MENEDIQKQREDARKLGLANIESKPLMYAALSNIVNSGVANYGTDIQKAIADKYNTYLSSEEGGKMLSELLKQSRQNGQVNTGSLTEPQIGYAGFQTIQNAFGTLKISDILELTGSKKEIKPEYQDKYLADLAGSENKEEKELVTELASGLMTYYLKEAISETVSEEKANIGKTLEDKLTIAEA